MSVCLKPQLIHTGIERIKSNFNSQDIFSDEAVLGIDGKFLISKVLKLSKKPDVWIEILATFQLKKVQNLKLYVSLKYIFILKYIIFHCTYLLLATSLISNLEKNIGRRNSRFLRAGIKAITKQINAGKDVVLRTYTKQFWSNWKINYEFIFKAYFMKIGQMITMSSER